jgi:hypothetical protein
VSDSKAVPACAAAAELGDVVRVVSTAGLSPMQASAEAVLAVDPLRHHPSALDVAERVVRDHRRGIAAGDSATTDKAPQTVAAVGRLARDDDHRYLATAQLADRP